MKAIVAFFDLPGFTQKNYDDILTELKNNGGWPPEKEEGLLSHVSFQKGDNWCVVDVWESQEQFMAFGQNRLFPIFGRLGLHPAPPQVFPAHIFAGAEMAKELI